MAGRRNGAMTIAHFTYVVQTLAAIGAAWSAFMVVWAYRRRNFFSAGLNAGILIFNAALFAFEYWLRAKLA